MRSGRTARSSIPCARRHTRTPAASAAIRMCAAAAALHGFIPFDTPVKIKMRGGEFEATVKKNFRVFLLGKTETVFDGTYFAAEDMYGKNK